MWSLMPRVNGKFCNEGNLFWLYSVHEKTQTDILSSNGFNRIEILANELRSPVLRCLELGWMIFARLWCQYSSTSSDVSTRDQSELGRVREGGWEWGRQCWSHSCTIRTCRGGQASRVRTSGMVLQLTTELFLGAGALFKGDAPGVGGRNRGAPFGERGRLSVLCRVQGPLRQWRFHGQNWLELDHHFLPIVSSRNLQIYMAEGEGGKWLCLRKARCCQCPWEVDAICCGPSPPAASLPSFLSISAARLGLLLIAQQLGLGEGRMALGQFLAVLQR